MSTGSINFYSQYLIPVPEVLHNDSKLQEILWNFCRFPPECCPTLSQNPHLYNHLPTLSNVNWKEFNTKPTEENWHTYDTKPICVLTDIPGCVFLKLCPYPWAFDNVWNANRTLIFKSKSLSFRFFFHFDDLFRHLWKAQG